MEAEDSGSRRLATMPQNVKQDFSGARSDKPYLLLVQWTAHKFARCAFLTHCSGSRSILACTDTHVYTQTGGQTLQKVRTTHRDTHTHTHTRTHTEGDAHTSAGLGVSTVRLRKDRLSRFCSRVSDLWYLGMSLLRPSYESTVNLSGACLMRRGRGVASTSLISPAPPSQTWKLIYALRGRQLEARQLEKALRVRHPNVGRHIKVRKYREGFQR